MLAPDWARNAAGKAWGAIPGRLHRRHHGGHPADATSRLKISMACRSPSSSTSTRSAGVPASGNSGPGTPAPDALTPASPPSRMPRSMSVIPTPRHLFLRPHLGPHWGKIRKVHALRLFQVYFLRQPPPLRGGPNPRIEKYIFRRSFTFATETIRLRRRPVLCVIPKVHVSRSKPPAPIDTPFWGQNRRVRAFGVPGQSQKVRPLEAVFPANRDPREPCRQGQSPSGVSIDEDGLPD